MWFTMRAEDLSFLQRAPVRHSCEAALGAPRRAVFAEIAEPRTWNEWFPGVRSASYTSGAGVGAVREAHVGSTHWVERMIAWDEDRRWSYTVTSASVPLAVAQVESFELEDAGNGTRVRWTLALEPRLLWRIGAPFAPRVLERLFVRAMGNLDARIQEKSRVAGLASRVEGTSSSFRTRDA